MRRIILIVIAILFLLSCEKTTTVDYDVIDSNITIKMNEELGNPSRTFKLDLYTEKINPCCNYTLITNSKKTTNKIVVSIQSIYKPDICLTAFGPAYTTIPIKNLENKSYDIEFILGDNISTGKLICASTEFKLKMNNLIQIKIDGPVIKRIPNNLIWGTVGYHSPTTINKVNDFIDSIKELGASELFLENGNYIYFEIDDNKIKEPTNSGYWFTKSFVFKYDGDKSIVRSHVKDYSKEFGDLMSISVYGDKGEKFWGWVLQDE